MGVGNPSAWNEHRAPERDFVAPPAQTERKPLNHQRALFPTREFVLEGRINERYFMN